MSHCLLAFFFSPSFFPSLFFHTWAYPTNLASVSASIVTISVWGSVIDAWVCRNFRQTRRYSLLQLLHMQEGNKKPDFQSYPFLNVSHVLGKVCVLSLWILRRTQCVHTIISSPSRWRNCDSKELYNVVNVTQLKWGGLCTQTHVCPLCWIWYFGISLWPKYLILMLSNKACWLKTCKFCLASMLRTEILEILGSWFEKVKTNPWLITSLLPPALKTWPFSGKQESEHKYIQLQMLQWLYNDS